jgi:hypothetical protein
MAIVMATYRRSDMTFRGQMGPSEGETGKKHIIVPKPEITVQDIARAAFKAAKGDVKRAASIMEHKVRSDATLLAQLSEEFIRIVCVQTTGVVLRQTRKTAWLPPNYDPGGKGSRIAALAKGNEEMLMAFPLPGGKPLGDADSGEVLEAAEFYGKQARDMGHKARWLSLIASRVPEGKTVKESLSEKKLRQLQRESGDA